MGPSSIGTVSINGHSTASKLRARNAAASGSACARGRVTITRISGGHERSERCRNLVRISAPASLDPAAVFGRYEPRQLLAVVMGGNRCETAAADRCDAGTLRLDTEPRLGVIGRGNERLLAGPDLQRKGPLSRFGNDL